LFYKVEPVYGLVNRRED